MSVNINSCRPTEPQQKNSNKTQNKQTSTCSTHPR